MKYYAISLFVLLLWPSGTVCAQLIWPDDFERIMLPVVVQRNPLPGAAGSLWVSPTFITNISDTPIAITGIKTCDVGSCGIGSIAPGESTLAQFIEDRPQGTYIWVEKGKAEHIDVSLRVRDLSRQSETFGTAIPAVRESDVVEGAMSLIALPTSDLFRVRVRIYDLTPETESEVVIRFYKMSSQAFPAESPDEFLFEDHVTFRPGSVDTPSFFEVGLDEYEDLSKMDALLRIEVEPLTRERAYWAFASITNNVAQHVTIEVPR